MKTPLSPTGSIDDIEVIISHLLRWGVLASLILIGTGTILRFLHSGDYGAQGGTASDLQALIRPEATLSFTVPGFIHGLSHGQGQSLIIAGLILLIATPVLRVAISIVTFVIEKDWVFAAITSLVFVLLLCSFYLGKIG